jgi:hypothetical protein
MRLVAALLLVSVAACSAPSYSVRSSSPMLASAEPRSIVLVPSVRHGHSTMWKTGAIITFASMGVTLLGAVMTIYGLGNLDNDTGGNMALFTVGIITSAAGDAGMLIGGPATWLAGIGRDPE